MIHVFDVAPVETLRYHAASEPTAAGCDPRADRSICTQVREAAHDGGFRPGPRIVPNIHPTSTLWGATGSISSSAGSSFMALNRGRTGGIGQRYRRRNSRNPISAPHRPRPEGIDRRGIRLQRPVLVRWPSSRLSVVKKRCSALTDWKSGRSSGRSPHPWLGAEPDPWIYHECDAFAHSQDRSPFVTNLGALREVIAGRPIR